jgi:hypothetical protein
MDETGKRSLYISFFTHPDMLQYEDRLRSFKNWSKQLIPDKYTMAEAGFLYTGQSDIVQCFACNVRVSEWDKTDNVWKEHLKWSPDCIFLKMIGYGVRLNTNLPTESKPPDSFTAPQLRESLESTSQTVHNGFNFCTGPDQPFQFKSQPGSEICGKSQSNTSNRGLWGSKLFDVSGPVHR